LKKVNFLAHPLVLERPCFLRIPFSREAAAFGFIEVCLNPYRAIDPWHRFGSARANSFNNDEGEASSNINRPSPSVWLQPGG